jgi:transcriptional regulator with XRE-family HTH domain
MCQIVVTGDCGAPIVVIRQDMSTNFGDWTERLRESRRLMGLKQSEMAALGRVSLNTQNRYEAGTIPPIEYLLRIGEAGADWYWIITGQRIGDGLSQEESRIVDLFRAASPEAKAAVLAVLQCMVPNMHAAAPMGGADATLHDKQSTFRGE